VYLPQLACDSPIFQGVQSLVAAQILHACCHSFLSGFSAVFLVYAHLRFFNEAVLPHQTSFPSRRLFIKHLAASGAVLSARPPSLLKRMFLLNNKVSEAQLASDALRPQFHLLPKRNWMNDPNGPVFWNGNYHMFFQYNPNAAVWGDMHWNHAVSPDLVHWKHLPIALAPTPGGPDQDGCFSGSVVIQDDVATIVYTGVRTVSPSEATLRDGTHNFLETQCLATSSDPQLLTWKKVAEPVLFPPQNVNLTGFRDPFLWRAAGTWYMGIGSGVRGAGGNVLLYRSTDLRHWEASLNPLATGHRNGKQANNPVDSAEMWECPDFFPLGKKHLLFYSTERKVFWDSGEFDAKQLVFYSQKSGLLDYGDFYAPKSQLAPDSRRILWGWIPESRPEAEFSAAGWAGCMSLPRVLSLAHDGNLEIRFAKELQSLRSTPWSLPPVTGHSGPRREARVNFQLSEPAAEILLRFSDKSFQLLINAGTNLLFDLSYDPQTAPHQLKIAMQFIPIPANSSGQHQLHLFLDASVLECILDHSIAFTTRLYSTPNSNLGLAFSGAEDALSSLAIWPLLPISSDRLTT
jgi:beta-fructofuranosidase